MSAKGGKRTSHWAIAVRTNDLIDLRVISDVDDAATAIHDYGKIVFVIHSVSLTS